MSSNDTDICRTLENQQRSGQLSTQLSRSQLSTRAQRLTANTQQAAQQAAQQVSQLAEILFESSIFHKVEAYGTALLSIADMASDLVMIIKFSQSGRSHFALATAMCVTLNILISSLCTYFIHKKKSLWKQLREQLFVFLLLKPGIDAWRIKRKRTEEQLVDAQAEMTVTRTSEMLCEAIPGTVILLVAVMTSAEYETVTLLSLFSSVSAAAFLSALISYGWDTDKDCRHLASCFYGYVPDPKMRRVTVFLSLFFLSLFNLFVRAFACVLFFLHHGFKTVVAILLSELLLYFCTKIVRGDFAYWAPIYGPAGIVTSFIVRFLIKVVGDWTAVVQFRHPNETGGAYFTFSMGLTIFMGMVAALLYDDTGETSSIKNGTVVKVMAASCLGMVFSFTSLLVTIRPEYRSTFINPSTGNAFIEFCFVNGEDDERKITIFENNVAKWQPRIGKEVESWLDERLPHWIKENPVWLNDFRKSTIPSDMMKGKSFGDGPKPDPEP